MLEKVGKTIGIWGDSILKGVVFDDIKASYSLLKENCVQIAARALGLTVVNRSRFGSTVDKGRQLLEKALADGLACDAVLLEYGGNDCDFDWAAVSADPTGVHESKPPLPALESGLGDMVEMLRARDIQPVLMSLPPIDGHRYLEFLIVRGHLDRTNMLRFLGSSQRIYQYQEAYSLAVTRLAHERKCLYVPVREEYLLRRSAEDLLCSDGIHPNEKGHTLMQEIFTRSSVARLLLA